MPISFRRIALGVLWGVVGMLLLSTAIVAKAGEAELSWTPPTSNCDGTPLTDLDKYRIYWGVKTTDVAASVTSYPIMKLPPGDWWFSVAAVNASGDESQFVTVKKTVQPSEFVTTSDTVYTFVKADGGILVLPTLHKVPVGTQCDATQSVNGKYILPRSAVTWSGSARPVAVLGDCG